MSACSSACGFCGRCTEGAGGRTVPCKLCRAPVKVASRTHSIFATVLCERCNRQSQATQDRKMDQGAA